MTEPKMFKKAREQYESLTDKQKVSRLEKYFKSDMFDMMWNTWEKEQDEVTRK